MKVDVYRNLHNGLYSIKARSGNFKGLVVAHARQVWLDDVEFVVSQAGRARVLHERKKYVHAFVRGTLSSFKGFDRIPPEEFRGIGCFPQMEPFAVEMMTEGHDFTYNPYRYSSFVDRDTESELHQADHAFLCITHGTKYLPSEGIYMGGAGRL